MTQALNYLLPEHKDLSSDFQHPWKSSGCGHVHIYPEHRCGSIGKSDVV